MQTISKLFAIFALAFLSSTTAQALDFDFVPKTETLPNAVVSGFEAWHSERNDELNGHNTGIGVRLFDGYTVGAYYNSIRRWSVYAGREFQWNLASNDYASLNVGTVVGFISGYIGGVKIMAIPEIVTVIKQVEVAVIIIPRYTKDPVTIAGQLRYRF
ncbi:MAG: hypothetical protein QM776_12430 [Rhodocyclaceae bacterium]